MNNLFYRVDKARILVSFALLVLLLVDAGMLLAQAPLKMQDQMVVRNAAGALVVNQPIGLRLGIRQGSSSGVLVFQETHTPTTNANGLANVEVGGGQTLMGNMASINWDAGPYFLCTEIDATGGNNYNLSTVQQLLSVPYALFSATTSVAGNGLPPGGSEGQVLTNCGGTAVWANGGQCPPVVSGLDCGAAMQSGLLFQGQPAANVSITLPYTGGNGAVFAAQSLSSGGVNGLTATLLADTLNSGFGTLLLSLSGTPAASGVATFTLVFAGQTCTFSCNVLGAGSASCGAVNVHNPNLSYGTVTDQDGMVYKTMVIGAQEWMAENLSVAHYRNGDPLPMIPSGGNWLQGTTGVSCWYGGDSTLQCPLGRLYNWYAATDPRGLCPVGWHLPSDSEWNTLIGFIDPSYSPGVTGTQSTTAGGKMKSTGTAYWSGNNPADNSTGFSALGGGHRTGTGSFTFQGAQGAWWSATPNTNFVSWFRFIYNGDAYVGRGINSKSYGYSIRCVRD